MVILTEDIIRKKAEHNDGILADLEEISLHQMEIEKIEVIQLVCPKLKILYLQNNIIDRMENLQRFKSLQYLNLAMNNVLIIENLESCEDLNKLDMTLNFIDLEMFYESIENLKANADLENLYLTGNPCMDWPRAREYIIAKLSNLKHLDGKEITQSERIQARRVIGKIEEELQILALQNKDDRLNERGRFAKNQVEGAYTRQNRTDTYRQLAKEREDKEARRKDPPPPPKEPASMYNSRGEVRQCNEGKYDFHFDDEDPEVLKVEVFVPRYLETSMIDVDIHPTFFRCVIRNKTTQLRLLEEVMSDKSKVLRSKTTGALMLMMPRVNPRPSHAPRTYLSKNEMEKVGSSAIKKREEKGEKPAGLKSSVKVDIFRPGAFLKGKEATHAERLIDSNGRTEWDADELRELKSLTSDSDSEGPPPLERIY